MTSSIKFLWIVMVVVSLKAASCQPQKLSAYDVLMEYGFPVGLLPKGAIGYSLNRESGEFAVYFDGSCTFDIESYSLSYKSTITGVITNGRLYKLKGVTVKVLLLWLNIVEVTRQGDDIYFSVGIASADFEVENFLESPQCGCGFDCNNLPLNGDFSQKSQNHTLKFEAEKHRINSALSDGSNGGGGVMTLLRWEEERWGLAAKA
ncbi:hypothetical protein Fmac_028044 [Flemingia macrophylla]|uniref:DUF538 domain-containing protein n=1 Tax=Flemingia macrophylla TaxID=520843 RepID=A0ABD1LJF6_9FABA